MGKLVRVLALLYLAYVLITVLVVMPAANVLAPWFMQQEYGRELRADIILFNPFTFDAQIRGATLSEPDGSEFAAIDHASVDLSLASLVTPGVVLDEVAIEGLRLALRRTGPDHYNVSDFMPPAESQEPENEENKGMPAVTIKHFVFTGEHISLHDETRETPFTTYYDGINITVNDLSTIAEEGKPYRIIARAESGGELEWEGTVSIPSARSEGRLRVSGLSLRPAWRFAEPWLDFELHSGELGLQGDYSVSWADGLEYSLSDGGLTLGNLNIQPLQPAKLPDTRVGLGRLGISGVSVLGSQARVNVEAVNIEGLDIAGWMEEAQVSLVDLFAMKNLPEPEPAPASTQAETGPQWQVHVQDIKLTESALQWRSPFTQPATLNVTPISARVQAMSWPLRDSSPLSLAFTINNAAHFELDGAVALDSGEGALDYSLTALPIDWFNPNLPEALKATITGGQLDVRGSLTLSEFMPVTVELDGGISDFSGRMEDREVALTRWDSVRLEQLRLNLEQRNVYLAKLVIHDYEGRLHIAEDGSINASKVWQQEVGEKAEEIAGELHIDKAWEVEIPEIFISDSAIDFQDESLPIAFRTVVGDVNGEILNISSAPGAAARVGITGAVDGYAPVSLSGSAAPLDSPPALDLALTFNGVDMALLSPYSATYAGYAIERGLLNLDLGYSLENNHLTGRNEVVINQLKLGDKIDSDKALDVPLQLALALLTDVNGVIDLSVPVEGDVDDPSFAIGSVVASALVNLLTKAVTAPFALLGSLVGAEDDLQKIALPAGSAELGDSAKDKIALLHDALSQRPGLTLVITGEVKLDADRRALQQVRLDQALVESGLAAEEVARHGAEFMAAVDARFEALDQEIEQASFQQRYDAVLATVSVSDKQLLELAQERARTTKDYMVNELALPAERAVIQQAATLEPQQQAFSGIALDLDY